MIDCRHELPRISTRLDLDWSNPLLYWAVGVILTLTATGLLIIF